MESKNLSSIDSNESSQTISGQWISKAKITKEQLEYDFNILKLNQTQIAVKYGCTTESIRRARERWCIGWLPFTNFYISEEDLRKDLLQEGLSQAEIASKLGCSTTVIKKYIKEYDIEMDSRITYVSSKKVRKLIVEGKTFTDLQREVIVGSILGDGNIAKMGTKGNAFLQIAQRNDRISYLIWLADQLQPFSRAVHHHCDNVSAFGTVCHSDFNYYYDLFWKDGRKTVPSDIVSILSEISLARWFEQDGHLEVSSSLLCTNCFTVDECNLLLETLKLKFGIEGNISMEKDIYPRLRFKRDGHRKFHTIVDPLLHSCFEYKKLPENRAPETISKAPS